MIIKDQDKIPFRTRIFLCNMLPFHGAIQFDSPYLNRVGSCTNFHLRYQPQPNSSSRPLFQPIESKRGLSVQHNEHPLVADLVYVELFGACVKKGDCSVDAVNNFFWSQFLNDVFQANRVGKESSQQFMRL